MPSDKVSSITTTFQALPRRKEQQEFSTRRKTVKREASLPKLTKSQSRLTQLDFERTPSSVTEDVHIRSDSEYDEPRPKKKRKTSKGKGKFNEREADQSGMTQFVNGNFQSISGKSRLFTPNRLEFSVWEDYDPDQFAEEVNKRQQGRAEDMPWLKRGDSNAENEAQSLEIPQSSHLEVLSSPQLARHVDGDALRTGTGLQTPRKSRFGVEVPSSQSPPSTRRSMRSDGRIAIASRSPLKEKSNNVQSSQQSQETQHATMKMLERVRFASKQIPLNDDAPPRAASEAQPLRALTANEEEERPNEPPRKLRRVTTVQDSQIEDCGTLVATDSAEHLDQALQRITSMQDSDFDGTEQLESRDDLCDFGVHVESGFQEKSQYFHDDDQQATLDPAFSALDRDAARFGRTQTQPALERVEESCVDDETEDEDLDRGCPPATASRAKYSIEDVPTETIVQPDEALRVQDEQQPETRQAHLRRKDDFAATNVHVPTETIVQPDEALRVQDEQQPETRQAHLRRKDDFAATNVHDDSAYESGDPTRQVEVDVPSSPPVQQPHPSQVSTVMPTQLSQPQLAAYSQRSPRKQHPTQPFTLPSSPHESYFAMPGTLPSSPLLLPPWSSPGRAYNARTVNEARGLGSDAPINTLTDFSLPPPPLLSSSRRQTPASSST